MKIAEVAISATGQRCCGERMYSQAKTARLMQVVANA
jgi:hypothetical protein